MIDLSPLRDWKPGRETRTVTTVDAHTGGEPFRVVTGGVPPVPGGSMLEKRRYARQNLDGLRRALMWEPRGHADMYGCLLTEPTTPGADLGVLFMHNEGFSTMCGHGIIALVTVFHETGCLPNHSDRNVRIDTPAGVVTATAHRSAGILDRVSFRNVPSFVLHRRRRVDVQGIGALSVDVAFGGAFYAFVDARAAGLSLEPDAASDIVAAGRAVTRAVSETLPPVHPQEDDLSFLYGTIFTDRSPDRDTDSRHVCVFADGELDRSPTGTGVSARVALLHASGDMPAGRPVRIDSIVGSTFEGRADLETTVGNHVAIVPEVSGRAWICGHNTWLLDPGDPFVEGFLLR